MQRRILIIDDHDDLATALSEVFSAQGHHVSVLKKRSEAVALGSLEDFDLVISDLDVDPGAASNGAGAVCLPEVPQPKAGEFVKAFKLCAARYRRDGWNEEELKEFVATVLDYKIRKVDTAEFVQGIRENIQFELPSALSLMHIVLEYLMKRVEKLGVCKPEQTNLFVALDEAFVNAIKHGNKYDPNKLIRVLADVSPAEARFTIEDEGEGFDINNIPDPLDPENLFKTSGRGVLFIHNIMDEVTYNARGNQLTMVKKAPAENCEA
jgi:serine/threonine-protein kinase RsbW